MPSKFEPQPTLLSGKLIEEPVPFWRGLFARLMISMVLKTWIAFVAALVGVGAIGTIQRLRGRPGNLGQLWICLPSGLLMVGVATYAMWRFRRMSMRTVLEFHCHDGRLGCQIRERGAWIVREESEVAEIEELQSRRGPEAYIIRFRDGEWVRLSARTEHAEELLDRLRRG